MKKRTFSKILATTIPATALIISSGVGAETIDTDINTKPSVKSKYSNYSTPIIKVNLETTIDSVSFDIDIINDESSLSFPLRLKVINEWGLTCGEINISQRDFIDGFSIDGLSSDTEYDFEIYEHGKINTIYEGSFKTQPLDVLIVTIAKPSSNSVKINGYLIDDQDFATYPLQIILKDSNGFIVEKRNIYSAEEFINGIVFQNLSSNSRYTYDVKFKDLFLERGEEFITSSN